MKHFVNMDWTLSEVSYYVALVSRHKTKEAFISESRETAHEGKDHTAGVHIYSVVMDSMRVNSGSSELLTTYH